MYIKLKQQQKKNINFKEIKRKLIRHDNTSYIKQNAKFHF